MLKLMIGPSGSGKTQALIQSIKADIEQGIRCFLLVPEQQAYISERDIPAALPQNAGLFFEVTHFSGLAEDVFQKYGGVTQGNVSGAIRSLFMWDTLRELSPLLKQYGKSAGKDATLTRLMLQTVDELHLNGIEADQMEAVAGRLPSESALRKKMSDIALVDAVFREKIKGAFGTDPSDKLLRMAKILSKHNFFEKTHVYIDSFTSFTAQEYQVLLQILRQADTLTVSLCANAYSSSLPHFESTVETARRLAKLAAQTDQKIEKSFLSAGSTRPKALSVLERDIWNFDLKKNEREAISPSEQETVQTVVCSNLYEECEAAALHILKLVQSGMRYGDIAVMVRDTEVYRGVLDAALERRGIPYFISESTDLSAKPLSRLILSALRAVSRHYQYQDIMTLVKTDLTGADFRSASMFEEYCETWHITGSRFQDPVWSMNPDGLTTVRSARAEEILEAANSVRKTVMGPLLAFETELRASTRLSDRCRALYRYLCSLNISKQLSDRARAELSSGQRREAGETLRLYRFVTEALTTLSTLLPDAELNADELISVLTILFSETPISSVPSLHDCVMIGSAATVRVENIKSVLLLGLCEGEFPLAIKDDGILTENDKVQLEAEGISLDSRSKIRSSEELLYVYRAITKPTSDLYLSTVAMQIDGSAKTPSLAFSRVCFLLNRTAQKIDYDRIRRSIESARTNEWKPTLKNASATSGTQLRLSQSKIKTFVQCPFSYYCTYQLKLREKKDSRPSYADDGTFLHFVFEQFLKKSLGADGKLSIPEAEKIEEIATAIVDEYISIVCPIPAEHIEMRLLHLFARLRKLALIMLREILNELHLSDFVPKRFEQVIGTGGADGLPAVTLDLRDGSRVILSGTVDRVDMMEKNGRVYVRIVDYKSGTHKFSLDDVVSGLDIQLVLYLFAVLSDDPEKYVASGAQYMYAKTEKGVVSIERSGFLLQDEEILASADHSEDRAYTKKLLAKTQEEIQELIIQMQDTVRNVAERILSGEAQKTPSADACRFCVIAKHCDKAYHKGKE